LLVLLTSLGTRLTHPPAAERRPVEFEALGIAAGTGPALKACRRMSAKPGPQAMPISVVCGVS
jgi:hypothetical protein